MKIVIDIDDNLYTRLFDNGIDNYDDAEDMATAIRKGTPLPKGHGRKFEEIVVEYPPAELCTYPEYRGKPYFSIKYEENGEHIIGFGTYNQEVFSRYLREYFITPTIIEADKAESEDKLGGDPIDIDKAIEHYEGTLEVLKGIDLEVDDE